MKKGKRVLSIILVGVFLIVCISLVNAGLKEWLGFGDDSDLEGELPESATAKLKIKDDSPPIVVYVSPIADVALNPRQTLEGNVSVGFWFLAQQGVGGPGNLELSTSSRGAFNKTGVLYLRSNSSCNDRGTVGCNGLCTGTARNYSCLITMRYFDNESTWTINASVSDGITLKSGYNNTKTFIVQALMSPYLLTPYINFTTPVLLMSAQYRYSDNNISIVNDGNQIIGTVTVNASGLNGTGVLPGQSNQQIPPFRFTVNPTSVTGSCPGNILTLDTNIQVPGFAVPKANDNTGAYSNFTSCLFNLTGLEIYGLPPLSSQDYNATRMWQIGMGA